MENKGLEHIQNKDRRISYLSLISSLCSMWKGEKTTEEDWKKMIKIVEKTAYELNDSLYLKYPFPSEPLSDNQIRQGIDDLREQKEREINKKINDEF